MDTCKPIINYMIAEKDASQTIIPGAIAKSLSIDEQWIAATRLQISSHLQGLCDTPYNGFTKKRLRTLSAAIGQLLSFAKHHFDNDLEAVFQAWQDNTLIIPFALQSENSSKNLGEDGYRIRGGFFGFLKAHLPREYVTDSWGNQHYLPAAPRKEVAVRELFEQIEPLQIMELSRNGKVQTTSVAILHLPKLFILAEVVEQMIADWACFEAVPAWHKAIRHDFNLVFGMDKYSRSPENGAVTLNYSSYEDMVEDCDEICPAIAQDPIKLVKKANTLGMTFLYYCCQRYYAKKEDFIEASVRIANQLFVFGRSSFNYSIKLEKSALKFVVERMRTGAIALLGVKPLAPAQMTPAMLFG
jgi:hypothetical protein